MLYERWQSVARLHDDELALLDAASGQRWTFAQLAHAAEQFPLPDHRLATPRGNGPAFILTVLAAWRVGRPVLPLEGEAPVVNEPLPAGVVHLKTTSGTTRASQLIGFTAEQLAADADQIVATMGLRNDQPNLGLISLAHSYGFSNLVTPLLLGGIPLVLVASPMPASLQAAAAGFRSLALPAVPAMWRAWYEANAIPANVTLAISAGAPLSLELEAAIFERNGLKLHNFYGSSECGGIAYDAAPEPRGEAALAGRPLQGVTLSLAEDGCLVVTSAAVGVGYLPDDDARLGDGRFHTSDVAELRDGAVLLRGRSSDVINIAGRKLAPETVEAVLRQQPGVRECLVVGVPARDDTRGEEALAVLELAEGGSLEPVRRAAANLLPAWQCPRHWWVVPEIPSSQRGKISRREWREKFLGRRLA
jgi:long-chain acyl-CoA synthetase